MLKNNIIINTEVERLQTRVEKPNVKFTRVTAQKPVNDVTPSSLNPDAPIPGDYPYVVVPMTTPSSVDLRQYCPPVYDQGSLESNSVSAAHAIVGGIELLNRRLGKSAPSLSRLFLNYYARYVSDAGRINYGAARYIERGLYAANRWGVPLESYWPYDVTKERTRPVPKATIDGEKRRVIRYEQPKNPSHIQNSLAAGFPVVIYIKIYESFLTMGTGANAIMPYPDTYREKELGSQAVLLVGYNNTTQRYIARNSRGSNWGDNGYFYIPYSVYNGGYGGVPYSIKRIMSPL